MLLFFYKKVKPKQQQNIRDLRHRSRMRYPRTTETTETINCAQAIKVINPLGGNIKQTKPNVHTSLF